MAKKLKPRPTLPAPLNDNAAGSKLARAARNVGDPDVGEQETTLVAPEVLSADSGSDLAHVMLQARSHYSGPLPRADEFAQYEQARAGSADRILALAESEQQARHELDRRQLDLVAQQLTRDSDERKRAQWMSFGLIVLGLFFIAGLAWYGKPTFAISLALASVGGISVAAAVVTYVKGGRRKMESLSISKATTSGTNQPD
jgi:uncharacterized membrane protein